MGNSLIAENSKKTHYVFIGKKYNKIIKRLNEVLDFFRIEFIDKFKGKEIFYDVKSNMLSNSGLVLSKEYEDGKAEFKVRKINTMVGGYKHPGKKFKLGDASDKEQPRDFALQIASAISNSFSSKFTVDLVSIVKQTEPKIQIDVYGKKYKIIGGTGYEAKLLYEIAEYRDLESKKKVKREGFTLIQPNDDEYEAENNKIIETIERYCKPLVRCEDGRFEIAKRLLFPDVDAIKKKYQTDDSDETEGSADKKS